MLRLPVSSNIHKRLPSKMDTCKSQHFMTVVHHLSSHLPLIPLQEMHKLCRQQEKEVLKRIMEIKSVDIYDEIASLCPMDYNLRSISNQELAAKLSASYASECTGIIHKSNSVTSMQQIEESDQYSSCGQQKRLMLRNILDEYDHQTAWRQMEMEDY